MHGTRTRIAKALEHVLELEQRTERVVVEVEHDAIAALGEEARAAQRARAVAQLAQHFRRLGLRAGARRRADLELLYRRLGIEVGAKMLGGASQFVSKIRIKCNGKHKTHPRIPRYATRQDLVKHVRTRHCAELVAADDGALRLARLPLRALCQRLAPRARP